MHVALVYCYPAVDPEKYDPAAKNFVESYMKFSPGKTEHTLNVVVNGDSKSKHTANVGAFRNLPANFLYHNNWAKDLGAFMAAANIIPADLLVCVGAQVNFWRAGWLDVIAESFSELGPAVYGTWAFQEPLPHIRTTFFWTAPHILLSYPYLHSEANRYEFEHGHHSIALWSQKQGFEPWQVTWGGAYSMKHWHAIPLDEALARDQHTARDFGI